MTETTATKSQVRSGLIFPEGFIWAGNTITYSIPGAGASWQRGYAADEPTDPQYGVLNAGQAANFASVMAQWDAYIAPSIVKVSDSNPGDIRVAFTDVSSRASGAAAYAYSPPLPGDSDQPVNGDVWIDEQYKGDAFAENTSSYEILLHEVGHALGLKHPFESPKLPARFDTTTYTVMSYTAEDNMVTFASASNGGISSSSSATVDFTPMVLDIMAIQMHYGADKATAKGNTVYAFTDDSLDGRQAIYDAGGNDTINLRALSRGSNVDLRPGAYSDIAHYFVKAQIADAVAEYGEQFENFITGELTGRNAYEWDNNVGLAFSTLIENVIGSNRVDSVIGNDAANRIRGLGGRDTLSGGKGNDVLTGNGAADVFVFSSGWDKDRITDFNARGTNHDTLDLSELKSITDFSDLKQHHLSFVDGDALIRAGGGDVIRLDNVLKADLRASDFDF